jgi:NAD+ kinase
MIKNIKLFVNKNDKSIRLASLVKENFLENGFSVSNENFDLGISIGGDGSFLRMIKDSCFNSEPYYIGINAGTLGFLQEVKGNEIGKLIHELKNDMYKVDEIGIQQTCINHDNVTSRFYSLNEIIVRDENLKKALFDLYIENDLLERFTGDGLLIATSLGSTAHNLSYGGSIVYNNFQTLQITPIAPINSKSYKTLSNSVIIPDKKEILIVPTFGKSLMVTIDGENNIYKNVSSISTMVENKKIKCLRLSHYNFPQKINEKLLSN